MPKKLRHQSWAVSGFQDTYGVPAQEGSRTGIKCLGNSSQVDLLLHLIWHL